MGDKIISAIDAIRLIQDEDWITVSGFSEYGVPDALLKALASRYLSGAGPRSLGLIFSSAPGDGNNLGVNQLGCDGLLASIIGGEWSGAPRLASLAKNNRVAAWSLPQGVIGQLYREISAKRPGVLTRTGIGSFVDPEISGGKVNHAAEISGNEPVERLDIHGEPHLLYKARPIQIALLRGTTADADGNISLEDEILAGDTLAQAMAVRGSGGLVIVQVAYLAARNALGAHSIGIPAALVDAVVLAEPEDHQQTYSSRREAPLPGKFRSPKPIAHSQDLGIDPIIARRALFELPDSGIVALGRSLEIPFMEAFLVEELDHECTFLTEAGMLGGYPKPQSGYGTSIGADIILQHAQHYDLVDGGAVDLAILGLGRFDPFGNIDLTQQKETFIGAGGAINLSNRAKKLVFAGRLFENGSHYSSETGEIILSADVGGCAARDTLDRITISAKEASTRAEHICYITECGVFEVNDGRLTLVELAKGIEAKQLKALLPFEFEYSFCRRMDNRIFIPQRMRLTRDYSADGLERRIMLSLDKEQLFLDFCGLSVRERKHISEIHERIVQLVQPLVRRPEAIMNDRGLHVEENMRALWETLLEDIKKRHSSSTTRYSVSAFLRMKIRSMIRPAPIFQGIRPEETRKKRAGKVNRLRRAPPI